MSRVFALTSPVYLEERPTAPQSNTRRDHLLLIDASPILYASHFAATGPARHRFRTSTGRDTTVLFLFLRSLFALLERTPRPTHVCVVFDPPGDEDRAAAASPEGTDASSAWDLNRTSLLPAPAGGARSWRHDLLPSYKGGRPPTPFEISSAVPALRGLLDAACLGHAMVTGVEADDLLATLATSAHKAGAAITLVSPDKDMNSLLSIPDLTLLRTRKRATGVKGASTVVKDSKAVDFEIYSRESFALEFDGLKPERFAELQALMGDLSDKIPGVSGIGKTRALKLLRAYDTLDEVLIAALRGGITVDKPAAKCMAMPGAVETARLCLKVASLLTDVDVPVVQQPLDFWRRQPPTTERKQQVVALLQELEFTSFIRRLDTLWDEINPNPL